MTNYEYLRNLSLEEMAKEFTDAPICAYCEQINDCQLYVSYAEYCAEAAAEWLKSERKVR